jgi:circadian clock protein KaiB
MSLPDDDSDPQRQDYQLSLFVTGHTPKSVRAVQNVTRICEQHLPDGYELEIVDLYQSPELASKHQLVAAPTLLKTQPPPPRRMVGDMSDSERVLAGLGIRRRG